MLGRLGPRVALRAALLLLAGTAVFALGLLPAHASGDPSVASHAGNAAHLSTAHETVRHSDASPVRVQGVGTSARHDHAPHEAHGELPLCHTSQASSALTPAHPGTVGSAGLLTVLLAAGLVAFLVTPLPHVRACLLPSRRRLRVPIRLWSGHRLLLLDCVSRV